MTQNKLQGMAAAIRDGKLVQAAGGITEEIAQSDKLGYNWRNIYVNDVLVRQEYVAQETPVGTADNHIHWVSGMQLIRNAYYVYGGETKVWMGDAGAVAQWTDSGFVPV